MRNFTFASIALLLVGTANASDFKISSEVPSCSREAMERIGRVVETPFKSKNIQVLKVPRKEGASDLDNTVIYEAPEGRVEHYNTSGQAYMAIMGMVGDLPVENFDTEMVFCDNGEVYWKNCITQMVPNSFIRGEDLGDRIEFALPQCIMSYPDAEGNIIDIYVHRMKYEIVNDATGEGWFFPDTDNDMVALTKGEDGMLVGDVLSGESILGMTTPEGEWYGYGNFDIVMKPGLETPVEIPEGLEPEAWQMICDGVGKQIDVAFDGDDVYLTNVFEYMPEAWVVGHVDGNEIVFPGHQYFGTFEMMQCSAYFEAITIEYDEEVDDYMPVKQEKAVCSYDAEAKMMKANDICFAMMGGPGYLFEYYENPEIRWQPADFEINLPNPQIIDCFNYDDAINYGVVAFNLPAMTKEGYALNPEYIYYRMYVDGDVFVFSPDEYFDLDEDIEWLPYLMDNYDIHCDGEYHQIDHYLDGVETFGVQAMYDDGTVKYMTDVVTASTVGVDSVNAGKDAVATVYYNLSGNRVDNPEKGVYVRVVTYSDGTRSASKAVMK